MKKKQIKTSKKQKQMKLQKQQDAFDDRYYTVIDEDGKISRKPMY